MLLRERRSVTMMRFTGRIMDLLKNFDKVTKLHHIAIGHEVMANSRNSGSQIPRRYRYHALTHMDI